MQPVVFSLLFTFRIEGSDKFPSEISENKDAFFYSFSKNLSRNTLEVRFRLRQDQGNLEAPKANYFRIVLDLKQHLKRTKARTDSHREYNSESTSKGVSLLPLQEWATT